jgi:hypothetical protein
MSRITIEKRDHLGQSVLRYEGELVERGENYLCIAAVFGHGDVDAGVVTFRRGDVMTEWFFSDRWFNIFRLQDVETGLLKGWYCNITRPAVLGEAFAHADDLALDVFISPRGQLSLLDEDEFALLPLSISERTAALAAVDALGELVRARWGTFAEIEG